MMDDQNEASATTSDDRITRALPYVVGLFAAFGLLIYNSTLGSSDDGGAAGSGTTVAEAGAAAVPVGAVRGALDGPDYDDVDVGEYNGTIILTGSVTDEAARAAAGDVAEDAADGAPVDNRIVLDGSSGQGDGDVAAAPVTAAASTVPATATTIASDDAAAAETDGTETAAAPDSTAPAVGPETTVAATDSTVAPAPETTVPAPAPETAVPAAEAVPPAPAPAPETTAPAASPEPTADELNAQLSELLKAEPVQFEKLASRIDPASFATLDRAAAVIMSSSSARFEVQGHTDSGGQPSFNQRLSEQRASSVRTYLIDRGVPADRLDAVGYGETRPTARNATPEGRALNRRVEIVVVP